MQTSYDAGGTADRIYALTVRASIFASLCLATASVMPANMAAADNVLKFSWPLNVGPLNPHLYSPNQMFAC